MPILFAIALAMLGALSPAFAQGKLNEACGNPIVNDRVLLPQAQRLADYRTANTRDEVQKACEVTMGDMAEIFPDVMLPRIRIIKARRNPNFAGSLAGIWGSPTVGPEGISFPNSSGRY